MQGEEAPKAWCGQGVVNGQKNSSERWSGRRQLEKGG